MSDELDSKEELARRFAAAQEALSVGTVAAASAEFKPDVPPGYWDSLHRWFKGPDHEVKLRMVDWLRRKADHIDENANALRKWADMEHEARCRELCAMYLREMASTLLTEMKIDDLTESLARAKDGGGGQDLKTTR